MNSWAPWPNGKALLSGGKDCGYVFLSLYFDVYKRLTEYKVRVPLVSCFFASQLSFCLFLLV